MPRHAILFALLFAVCTNAYGQRMVAGDVYTSDTHEPLAFATVVITMKIDSAFLGGTTTDMNGHFEIMAPGVSNVDLYIRMLGYLPSGRIHLPSGTNDIQLPPILLHEDPTILNDVVVQGQKPLFEMLPDRIVVNVESSVNFAGRSALYILNQTPGVIVNPNGAISANGRSGISVMLNGRVIKLTAEMIGPFLESLSASSIEKIEFVPNPDATVDAEGEAGVINIITKNAARGFRGSVFSTAGYGWKPKAGFGGNGTYAGEKIHLGAQYSLNRSYTTSYWDNFFQYPNGFDKLAVASYNVRHESNTDQALTFQADYRVTGKTKLGVNFIMRVRDYGYAPGRPSTVNTEVKRNDVTESYSKATYAERNRWDQYVTNFNIIHQINKKASVTADFDYLYSLNNIPLNYAFDYFENGSVSSSILRSQKYTPINTYVVKLDHNYSVNPGLHVGVGVKYTRNEFHNTFRVDSLSDGNWIRDELNSSTYQYREKIPAAYVSARFTLSPNNELSAGLRYESTQMAIIADGPELKRVFVNLFPQLSLTRTIIPGKKSITATLSRRINRPGYWDLAPFAIFLGPNVFVAGNESLRPSLNNSATINYSGQVFHYTLAGNFNQFTISNYQVRLAEHDNMLLVNAQNLAWSKNLHLTVAMPGTQLMRFWETSNSVTIFGERILADYTYLSRQAEKELFGFRFNSNHTFTLPRVWKFELNGSYSSTTLAGTSRQLGFGSLSAGVGKQLRNFSININASDMLWTTRWQRVTRDNNSSSEMRYLVEPRVVSMTLRVNIGNQLVRTLDKKSTASEEEQRRR